MIEPKIGIVIPIVQKKFNLDLINTIKSTINKQNIILCVVNDGNKSINSYLSLQRSSVNKSWLQTFSIVDPDYINNMTYENYKEIKSPCRGRYKEKGSKFIAYTFPVYSKEQVKEKLKEIIVLENTARHHCYAYILHPD